MRTKSEIKKRNQSCAANYRNTEDCPKCGLPYDGESYTKGICGSCERFGEARKKNMTTGERDCVEFMSRTMGFQLKETE